MKNSQPQSKKPIVKTFGAKFKDGVLEPTERLELREGQDVQITVTLLPVGRPSAVHHVELPRWRGKVLGPLNREEIYADLS